MLKEQEDDENQTIHTSAWTTFSFTLEDVIDSTIRVDAVSLTNDTGTDTTDGATADATITGTIIGGTTAEIDAGTGAFVDPVSVEIDVDGDGYADETATVTQVDNNGTYENVFTHTLESPRDGRNTVRVRVVDDNNAFSSGGWTTFTFVLFR